MSKPQAVHVINGSTAAACLALGLALPPNKIVALLDDLACGPLRPFRDVDSWRSQRLAFLTNAFGDYVGDRRALGEGDDPYEPSDLLLGDPDRLANAEEIILWIGTGLSEQLTLAWMLQFLKVLNISPDTLRTVQFAVSSRGMELCSTGMLSPQEFANAPGARTLTEVEGLYLAEAWGAVTSPEPNQLLGLVSSRDSPLPRMRAALSRLLARYPALDSGLNRCEERLLENTRDRGSEAARVVAHTLVDLDDEGDCVGDGWIFWRLRRLASLALGHPAVTLSGTRSEIRGTKVRLTEDGVQILAKQRSFVALNGIDDWIGGVHLDSRAGRLWYRQDGTLVPGRLGV